VSDVEEHAVKTTQARTRGIIGRLFQILHCEGDMTELLPANKNRLNFDPTSVYQHWTIRNHMRLLDFQQQHDVIIKLHKCSSPGEV